MITVINSRIVRESRNFLAMRQKFTLLVQSIISFVSDMDFCSIDIVDSTVFAVMSKISSHMIFITPSRLRHLFHIVYSLLLSEWGYLLFLLKIVYASTKMIVSTLRSVIPSLTRLRISDIDKVMGMSCLNSTNIRSIHLTPIDLKEIRLNEKKVRISRSETQSLEDQSVTIQPGES